MGYELRRELIKSIPPAIGAIVSSRIPGYPRWRRYWITRKDKIKAGI